MPQMIMGQPEREDKATLYHSVAGTKLRRLNWERADLASHPLSPTRIWSASVQHKDPRAPRSLRVRRPEQ